MMVLASSSRRTSSCTINRQRPGRERGFGRSPRLHRLSTLKLIGLLLLPVTITSPAAAQPPSLADIEGSSIEATVTEMRTVRADGKTGQQRAHLNLKLVLEGNSRVHYTLTITIHRIGKGDSDTRSHSARATLGHPHRFRDGPAVWMFEDGSLNLLRVQNEGGMLWKLILAKSAGALTCLASKAFAREDGIGGLATTSTNFGKQRVEFLASKVVASSCRMIKP